MTRIEAIAEALDYSSQDYSYWVICNNQGVFGIVFDDRVLEENFGEWDWTFITPNDNARQIIEEYFA